jgi:hypothetical protein
MNQTTGKNRIFSLFFRYFFVIFSLYVGAVACSKSASSSGDTAAASGPVADTTPPSTPGSFTATAISTSQINLTWLAATDAVTAQANLIYEVCQATVTGGCSTFVVTYSPGAGATNFNVTGLATATTYFFIVRVKDAAGNSRLTAEISGSTQTVGTVNTPTFGTAAGTYGATQNVTLASGTAGSAICYTTSGVNPVCDVAKTACTTGTLYATAVAISSSQTLKAIACKATYTDSSVNSAAYVIDTTIPSTPTAFTATSISGSQINLAWTASTDNVASQPNIVYEICQTNTGGGCGTFVTAYTTVSGATTFSVTGLNPVTTYYFVVRAKDTVGNLSNGATEAGATTGTAGTVATPTYTPVAGTYGAAQNVTIATATAGSIICYTTNGATPTCDVPKTGCTAGTLYTAAVAVAADLSLKAKACKATYTDSAVNTGSYVIDTSGPTVPANFTATPTSTTAMNVTWTAATDIATPQAGLVYDICQSTTAGGCNTFSATYTTAAGVVTHGVTGLTTGTRYFFKVRARDGSGNNGTPTAEFAAIAPLDNSGTKQWTRLLGVSAQNTQANATMADGDGNIYVTGYTVGNLDGQTLTGTRDAFVTKYSAAGVKQWTKLLGTATKITNSYAIAVDSMGFIWIGGSTTGLTGFSCANGTNGCLFVATINSDGLSGYVVKSVMGGLASTEAVVNGLTIDSANNIYIAGKTTGGLDGQGAISAKDGFIVKYDNSGTKQWTRLFGVATRQTEAFAIATDSAGNSYTTGDTSGSLNAETHLNGTSAEPFIIKYDANGTIAWTKLFGLTANIGYSRGIRLDSAGNIYIAGSTSATMDGNTLTGLNDAFLSKYNAAGTRQWTRMSGVSGVQTYATALAVDSLGNPFCAGYTPGALDGQTFVGITNPFVMKYNSSGTKQWTRLSAGVAGSNTTAKGLAKDNWGNIYMTGSTNASFDSQTLTGNSDLFLIKYQ